MGRDDIRRSVGQLDPLRAELSGRRQVLVERHDRMSAQVDTRVATLQRLASRSGDFAYQRQVTAEAVLDAYHELIDQTGRVA
jgi:hypothetical protein